MNRVFGRDRDEYEPCRPDPFEMARQRAEREIADRRDREAREAREAKERAAEREAAHLAALTAVASLSGVERNAALADFDRQIATQKYDERDVLLVLKPALQRRGDGQLFVSYIHFDPQAGKVASAMMPLAECGILLDPVNSPTARIDADRRAWELKQQALAAEEAKQRAHEDRARRLEERRAAAAVRLRSLPATHRACLYVAAELKTSQPKLSLAIARIAEHLGADDAETLTAYVEKMITDDE